MKVLFFNPEQYVPYDKEPSFYELRLPVLNCGIVTDYRDFVYQRIVRTDGLKIMQEKALQLVFSFRPDVIIYSTTWPEYLFEPWVLREIMDAGIPIYTHMWDTFPMPYPHELELFLNCRTFGVASTISNYLFYKSLAKKQRYVRNVVFTAGHNVFTDFIKPLGIPKKRDVTLIGSLEGWRKNLVAFLKAELGKRGISFFKEGGLLDPEKVLWEKGLRISDNWVDWNDYVRIINESKICINSQSSKLRIQIKGKIFDYLSCGVLVITDENIEIRKYVPEDCVVYYKDKYDLLEKICYYIEHEEERERIAKRGHNWFKETFDYKKFWSRVLEVTAEGKGDVPSLPGIQRELEKKWENQLNKYFFFDTKIDPVIEFPSFYQKGIKKNRKRVWCAFPWYKLELWHNGDFGPCCHYIIGNAGTPGNKLELSSLWNSEKMLELRKNLIIGRVEGTPCENCYDRLFSTDHDIFAMGGKLPRYGLSAPTRDELWRYAYQLYRQGRVKLPNLPLELNIITSERCNLKCVMCHQNKRLDPVDVNKVLSLVSDIGWESIDRFSFVGGEPFFAKDGLEIFDFVTKSDQKGACIYITTNGTLIHKVINKLEKIDNLFLTISIEGVKEAYEKVRRNSRWSRIIENLGLLKEAKKRHPHWRLNINSVVMNSTYKYIKELIDIAQDIGASIFFMPVFSGETVLWDEDIFLNPYLIEDWNSFRKYLIDAKRYAASRNAKKAEDSLDKLLIYWEKCLKKRKEFRIPDKVDNMIFLPLVEA